MGWLLPHRGISSCWRAELTVCRRPKSCHLLVHFRNLQDGCVVHFLVTLYESGFQRAWRQLRSRAIRRLLPSSSLSSSCPLKSQAPTKSVSDDIIKLRSHSGLRSYSHYHLNPRSGVRRNGSCSEVLIPLLVSPPSPGLLNFK